MKYGISILCSIVLLAGSGCGLFKKSASLDEMLKDAVVDRNGNPVSETGLLENNYLLLYFSAHWCPPCQAFTPKLVDFHKANGGGQLFETVLISSDHNETAMFDYMRETQMPWPAVKYQSAGAKELNRTFSGDGIPRLVLLDSKGHLLADSFKGREYLGPQSVLEKLKDLLAKRETDPVGISDATGEHLPTPEKLSKKYTINGFGKGSKNDIAIINGEFTEVGAELNKGVVVEKITPTYVEVSYEGNRYRLYP